MSELAGAALWRLLTARAAMIANADAKASGH
jgi:hypothetical protein